MVGKDELDGPRPGGSEADAVSAAARETKAKIMLAAADLSADVPVQMTDMAKAMPLAVLHWSLLRRQQAPT